MSRGGRLLIVGPSWVGDMVMAHALVRDLRSADPSAEIDILAPTWSLPLIERMDGVRQGIGLPIAHGEVAMGKRLAAARQLRGSAYGRAIVLPRSAKAALVPFLARIPRRTGFRGELRYGLINDIRPFDAQLLDMTVKRFRALGTAAPDDEPGVLLEPTLRVDRTALAATLSRLGLTQPGSGDGRSAVALMPGAEYGPAKQWPAARFRALARQLADSGWDVWVLGSEKERPLGAEIAADGTARNLCGETSLVEVVDLLSAASAAVSNDSGLMHVAAAVGTHVIGLYGSSSPQFTPPLTAHRTIVSRNLACSPCFARTCHLGHTDCLTGISVAVVRDAISAAVSK